MLPARYQDREASPNCPACFPPVLRTWSPALATGRQRGLSRSKATESCPQNQQRMEAGGGARACRGPSIEPAKDGGSSPHDTCAYVGAPQEAALEKKLSGQLLSPQFTHTQFANS